LTFDSSNPADLRLARSQSDKTSKSLSNFEFTKTKSSRVDLSLSTDPVS